MRATIALLAGLFFVLFATTAQAAPFELDWSAPPGCPSRERIVAATWMRLEETDSGAAPELFVRGRVSIEDGAIFVDFHMSDAEGRAIGERRVRIRESICERIVEQTSLVLAMMITVARPRELPPPSSVPSSPPASSLPSQPSTSLPSPRPSRRQRAAQARVPQAKDLRLSLSVSGVTSRGLFPSVGFGGALRSTATIATRFVLGIETSFETSEAKRGGTAGEATLRLVDAGLLGGIGLIRAGWLEIVPLVEVRGGVLTASATGFPSVRNIERLIGIVAVGVLGRVPLGRSLQLEVLPDLRIPVPRDEFQVRRGEVLTHVHRPAQVEARLAIGMGLEFP